ncbi:MAG: hypothetical protein ABI452_02390 [Candidatus Limnocylindrales bacterium]
MMLVSCGGPGPLPTATAVPTATAALTQAPTQAPTPPATPAESATEFEGLWASEPLTKDLMDAALTRAGLNPDQFHPWFGDWTGIDHRSHTVLIKDGVWDEHEYSESAPDGDISGTYAVDSSTLVVHDAGGNCDIRFELSRAADVLTIKLAADTCGPEDVMLRTAMYEASVFHLVEAADWQPPAWNPPSPPSSPWSTLGPATSRDRLTIHEAGSVAGTALGYIEYLPPNYSESGDKSPLLLFLHGRGESGTGTQSDLGLLYETGIPYLLANRRWPDRRPFVVLAPQHDSQPSSLCLEATEIHDFIQFALDTYNVDPARIYATGLSCGAIGLWNYVTQYDDGTLAAAVPIAGNGIVAFQERGCELATLPIWAFHGAIDPLVPISGAVYPLTQLQACANPPPVDARLTVFADSSHDVWSRTYTGSDFYDIFSWFLSHFRP